MVVEGFVGGFIVLLRWFLACSSCFSFSFESLMAGFEAAGDVRVAFLVPIASTGLKWVCFSISFEVFGMNNSYVPPPTSSTEQHSMKTTCERFQMYEDTNVLEWDIKKTATKA